MTTSFAGQWGPEPFIDRAGNALPAAVISIYESDGTTLAVLYVDRDRTATLANPLPRFVDAGDPGLDRKANGIFYAEPDTYEVAVEYRGLEVYRGPIAVNVDPAEQVDTAPGDLAAHEADTTNVHGIPDTALLENVTGSQAKATAALAAAAALVTAETNRAVAIEAVKADLVGGTVPTAQLPALAISETFPVASQAAMLALTAQRGDVAIRTDLNKSFILSTDSPGTLADWKELLSPTDSVTSVNARVGVVSGLAEADASNVAASATAWRTAIGAQPIGTYLTPANIEDAITDGETAKAPSGNAVFDALALKAPLASPGLTGTPTAPTAAPGTNTTQLATTAFVLAVRDALVDASPGLLDTLNELAAAIGDDANFAATMATALATKETPAGAQAKADAAQAASVPSTSPWPVLVTGLPTSGSGTDCSAQFIAAEAVAAVSGGAVVYPAGVYRCPGYALHAAVEHRGCGKNGTVLETASGDLCSISGSRGSVKGVAFRSLAGGGHCVTQTASVDRWTFEDVAFYQQNAGKSIWEANGFGFIDMHISDFDETTATSNSVPGWNFAGTGGDVNRNTWENGRHTGTSSGAYAWKLDSQHASSYYYDNVWRDINFETCVGGGIWLGGALNFTFDNLFLWDTTSATSDFLSVGAGTTGGLVSRVGRVAGCGNRASTFSASVYMFGIRSASATMSIHFESNTGTSSGNPFTINLNSAAGCTLRPGIWYSVTNGTPTIVSDAIQIKGGPSINAGAGSPEGVVTAAAGSKYHQSDDAIGAPEWIKATGTGNTGWVRQFSALWTPLQIASLNFAFLPTSTVWQDSARTIPAVADGDPVGAWDDVSPAAAHAVQVATTVAAGSNAVNTSTFAGAGTLNVASTTGFPTTGTITVVTGTTPATITYTGVTSTTFTGCTTTGGGGVMSTGGAVTATSARPLLKLGANGVGGLRCLRFNGSALVSPGSAVTKAMTLFAVHRPTDLSASRPLVGATTTNKMGVYIDTAGKQTLTRTGNTAIGAGASGAIIANGAVVSTIKYSSIGLYTFRKNGVVDGTPAQNNQSFTSTSPTEIGQDTAGGLHYLGDIAALLKIDSDFVTNDLLAIERWLGAQFKIAVA